MVIRCNPWNQIRFSCRSLTIRLHGPLPINEVEEEVKMTLCVHHFGSNFLQIALRLLVSVPKDPRE